MKKYITWITIVDILVYVVIFSFVIVAKIRGMESYESFREIVKEDGVVEYLTALFLFVCAIIYVFKAAKAIRAHNGKQAFFAIMVVLVFIFGAGEEISWGQRLFGIETSDYFMENNYQKETNLHNLKIGGVDLNILIFSQLMFVVLVFYFVFLGLLAWKSKGIRKLVLDFGVPIPRLHHVIVLLLSNYIVTTISLVKESELHEMALTGVLFLVFLNPAKSIKGVKLFRE
ncbi:MAG: hypothetical protein HQ522_09860 [Bacteroidetes bacterium]|nr:hypothetical protein [Bacteroidota bacterium]